MKEVAILTHYDLSVFRGGEKFVINLANALAGDGFKVTIYSLPFKRGVTNPKKFLSKHVKYISSFSFRKVDADIAYYIYAPLVYQFFFRDSSNKKIAGLHGYVITPELSSRELWNLSFPRFLMTHGMKATLAHYYLKISKKEELTNFNIIHVINPSTSLPPYLRKKAVYAPLWTEYKRTFPVDKEKEEKFSVLMLGTSSYLKGKDICHIILSFFSKVKEGHEMIFRSNAYIRHSMVQSLGFISEEKMPHLLSRSHVVLYPSRLDTFGMTIIESLNCGTPVITSDILAHRLFREPVYLCSSLSDYINALIHLYNMWKDGLYEIVRIKALKEGSKFTKAKVFPLYRRIIYDC